MHTTRMATNLTAAERETVLELSGDDATAETGG
jgi:hypothetical protein